MHTYASSNIRSFPSRFIAAARSSTCICGPEHAIGIRTVINIGCAVCAILRQYSATYGCNPESTGYHPVST